MTDIHNLFHDNDAPDAPTDGWADKVRARRQRSRVTTGVVAGVLAVGLAVPAGIALLNQGGTVTVAEPEPLVSAPVDPAVSPSEGGATPGDPGAAGIQPSEGVVVIGDEVSGPPICQAAAGIVQGRHEGAAQTPLTEGATRAWLCGDSMSEGALDPLTVGVDEAIRLILDQPEVPADQPCTMEYRMTYTVVFEYEDGAVVPVTGELHGCRVVNDGVTARSGGEELFEKVTSLWKAQRAESDFTAPAPTECSAAMASVLPVDLTQAAAVQTCTMEGETVVSHVPAGGADLAKAVADSIAVDLTDAGDMWSSTGVRLQVFDRWGSKLSLDGIEGGGFMTYEADGTPKVWTPSPELAEQLGLPAA